MEMGRRRRLSSVHTFKVVYISKVCWPILIKFHDMVHVKHHQVGVKAAHVFCADWIGTLIAMAIYSSHRLIMWEIKHLL